MGSQKIHVTCLSAIFTLLPWSGTELAVLASFPLLFRGTLAWNPLVPGLFVHGLINLQFTIWRGCSVHIWSFLCMQLSFLPYSSLQSLAILAFATSSSVTSTKRESCNLPEFFFLCRVWETSPRQKTGTIIGLHLFIPCLLGVTGLCCLMSTVLIDAGLCIFPSFQ